MSLLQTCPGLDERLVWEGALMGMLALRPGSLVANSMMALNLGVFSGWHETNRRYKISSS